MTRPSKGAGMEIWHAHEDLSSKDDSSQIVRETGRSLQPHAGLLPQVLTHDNPLTSTDAHI